MTPSRQTTMMAGPPGVNAVSTVSLSPGQFTWLRDLLATYSGVYLDAARQRVLEHGLARRLDETGDALLAYERRLGAPGGRDELRRLAELVLNHETVFFRNLPHLNALRQILLPEIDRRKPRGAPIRIWSAGCATGEEAYSLAIVALETLGWPLARPVEIWATDLSELALRKAREGFYRGRALQNVPPELLLRYFQPSRDGYVIGEAARGLVRFKWLNLLDPFPLEAAGIDIIFCQNVTIYFQLETCRRLIARFYDCLPENGLLFLGFSETLWNIFDRFHAREASGSYVYYKRALESRAPASNTTLHTPGSQSRAPAARVESRRRADREWKIRRDGIPIVSPDRANVFHDQTSRSATRERADDQALANGRALVEQGQIDQALETLRHIAPQAAHAPQALTLIARAHADRGELDLAAAEVQRAIEIDTLNDEAYLLLGIISSRQGQWPEAILQLERARYLNADSALISFHLAETYRQAGYARKATQEYRNTLRKLDQHPPGTVLGGVAVGWLRETCHRQMKRIPHPA